MIGLLAAVGLFTTLQRADSRVATIAWKLQTTNLAMCSEAVSLPGFSVQTLDQFDPAVRPDAISELGMGELPQVSTVVPDSAAARAGIRAGDAIAAIDGVSRPRAHGGPASYEATAAAEDALAAALTHPPAKLAIGTREIDLKGDPGCPSRVQMVPGKRLDASADGRYVQISGRMYEFTENDDELAFVIAHELAHNLLPEARRVARAGARQRQAELAADRAAVWMMARAGYDVDQAVPFLRRLSEKRALSWLDGSHPRWGERLKAVAAAASAVHKSRPSGSP